jgi:hypothetical protein
MSGRCCYSKLTAQFRQKPLLIYKNRYIQPKNIQIGCKTTTITGVKHAFPNRNEKNPSRNEKNHLHSFFCGGRIRDGSGTRGYGAFFLFEKGAGTSMGHGSVTSLRSENSIGLSPRLSGLACRCLLPSPFLLTQWFEFSFCASFRVLKEEAVCPCF